MTAKNAPFYQNRMPQLPLTSISQLTQLPLTFKEDLSNYSPHGFIAVPPEELFQYHESSGTTGKPVSTWMTKDDFYKNVDTKKAGKLSARLAQNVAGVFGQNSRITNFLEQTFQRSLPSLWNTNEGITAISELNMLSDEANIIKQENRKKILSFSSSERVKAKIFCNSTLGCDKGNSEPKIIFPAPTFCMAS